MPKDFQIKAGERVRVLHMVSDSIPATPRFRANTVDGNPATGKIEVIRGLFGGNAETHNLAAENTVTKGFWDANYSVYVTPDKDTKITFETRHVRSSILVWVLIAVLAIGLVSGLAAVLSASPPAN